MIRNPAAAALLAGALLCTPATAAISTLKFKVAADDIETSSITCVESTSGGCTVMTGIQGDTSPVTHRIASGGTIELKNPGGRLHYCVALKDRIEWPSCLDGTNAGLLGASRTVNKLLWD
ncbi:hypothetical protein GJ700_21940 [Duganella sp. FT92W]|uniref:Uncharacterized protein n=1 Tax=Pseudoduganella rivuli TaxID=2666085 RepID=A0A7X2LUX3_9BURK|nr:hypothetical protein [Pseudoduganella rivuli]MRV74373.1 hypothetical protein [Pseudoduganella rivuli]